MGTDLYASCQFLSIDGPASSWGHRITYVSRCEEGRAGVLGSNWFLADLPFLASTGSHSQPEEITVVHGAASVARFQDDGEGGWTRSDRGNVLAHDTVDRSFQFRREDGTALVFHSFDPSLPRSFRGKLKRVISGESVVGAVKYSLFGEAVRTDWATAHGMNTLTYQYAQTIGATPVLETTTLKVTGQSKYRVIHRFARGRQETACEPLLASSTLQEMREGEWVELRKLGYRYSNRRTNQVPTPMLVELSLLEPPTCLGRGEGAHDQHHHSTSYRISYNAKGEVLWIHHDGPGPAPFFI